MIFRIIIILVCILIFVNGCNSLISGLAGTHKLRTFSFEETIKEGIGDSDFIEVNGGWSSGEYIFEPHRNASWPGFVQWPVLSRAQMDSLENGQKVMIRMVAWTRKYDKTCLELKNCIQKGEISLKGLVRPLNKRFNKISTLAQEAYIPSKDIIYVEYNRQPLAWYWNLLLMIGAAGLTFSVERWLSRKEKKLINKKT